MIKKHLNKIEDFLVRIIDDINSPVILDLLDWFYDKLEIHFKKRTPDLKLKKWDIYFVNLWRNIWSELNKTRPCIVYSIKKANFWETALVIPLKSYKWKILNDFQVLIKQTDYNKLIKDSLVDISWIKQVSKKRILDKKWNLEIVYLKQIDKKILNIFWIKNKE